MIILVSTVKQTQLMKTGDFQFGYTILLYGATFDLAHVIENEILFWNIQFTFASSVHCRLLFNRYIETIVLTT